MKKLLSIILAILMIVTTIPFAFAADGDACTVKDCTGTYADGICSVCGGDGNKLEIDISTASAISSVNIRAILLHSDISAAGFYGDPDGYILTGSADDLLIEAVDSLGTPIEVVFDNVNLGYYMTVIGDAYFTFEGTNVIGNGVDAIKTSPSTEFNITINGDVEFKGQIESTLSDCKINVESGNVVFNLEGIRTNNKGICPVLNVKGGTTKILSADGGRTFNNDVILHNNAKLIMESLGSYIWTDGSFKMADDVDENTYFFVKTSADGAAVPTNDLSVYYASSDPNNKINYPYFELTLGTHDEHNYTNGKCVCGYECLHEKYTAGICDVCECPCSHENVTDGECDVCGKYIYAITHQPTKAEPYVELNDDTDATYQWYEVAGIEEITDENADTVSYDWGESSYDTENGWTGVTAAEDLNAQEFFTVVLNAGDTITVEITGDYAYGVGLWDYSAYVGVLLYAEYGKTTYELTAESDGNYTFYTYVNSGIVTVKAYLGEATYTAIEDETGETLKNPEIGNSYVCKVTAKDGTVLTSNVLDYSYKITHQPTEAEPYVELNDDTDATYQWYTVDEGTVEITDENAADGTSWSGEQFAYNADTGWTGIPYDDYGGYDYFAVYLEENETISVVVDGEFYYDIGIWDYDNFDGDYCYSNSENVYVLTAPYAATYRLYIDGATDDVTVKAYFSKATYTAIDDETGATLENPEYGNSYVCKVTAKDGTVLTSDVLDYSYKITHQPTEAEPYVKLNDDTDAAYQWYIRTLDFVAVDTSDADWIWSGSYSDGNWSPEDSEINFSLYIPNEGDVLTITTNEEFDGFVGNYNGDAFTCNGNVYTYVAIQDNEYVDLLITGDNLMQAKVEIITYVYTTPAVGETGETLKNPEYGNSYVCKVTAKDGTVLTSDVLDYSYKITHQPTEAEPYVELNNDTDATYQWYIVEGDLVEITDESATGSWSCFGAPDYIYGTYSANTGWTGAYYNGYLYYFVGEFKEGDVINFVFSDDVTDISVMGPIADLMITGSGKEWSATVGADGIYGFYAEGTEGTTLKAYLGEGTYTAIDGETGETLKNPEYGNSYVCEVTAKDGTVLTSDVLDYSYKITHQPTETEPYVELNDDTDATYQWYTVDEGTAEITNENADIVSYDWGESSYDAVNGWTGVAYEEGYIEQDFFTVVLNAGDTITVEITGDYAHGVGLWDYSAHEGVWLDAEDGKTTYELTAESDGNYTFYTDVNSGIVTVKAYLSGTTYTAIDGETSATLENPEMGNSYVCKVTFADGTTEKSDMFEITAVHTCDFTNYIEIEAATCETNAKETASCDNGCGETDTREVADTALGHDIIDDAYVAPTCTETGLTAGQHCSRCDYKVEQDVVPATNHKDTLVQVDAKAPTCTEIGWDAYEYCTACDYTTYVEIAALGHEPLDAVVENEADATCKADGSYDSVVYCGNCDEELDRETITVPALSHADEDGDYLCDNGCGYEFEKPVDPTPDTPDEPETPVEPETPDEPADTDCDHLCHKSGILGFFWKIISFFYKLFNIQQYCDCGALHYEKALIG